MRAWAMGASEAWWRSAAMALSRRAPTTCDTERLRDGDPMPEVIGEVSLVGQTLLGWWRLVEAALSMRCREREHASRGPRDARSCMLAFGVSFRPLPDMLVESTRGMLLVDVWEDRLRRSRGLSPAPEDSVAAEACRPSVGVSQP